MKKLMALLVMGTASVGCATGFNSAEMREALQEERKLFSDDDDVAKIEQLKPQLKLPFRLAVAPPLQVRQHYWHEPRGLMEGERDEIMAWGERLKKEGVVSEFILIPPMLMDLSASRQPTSYVKAVRLGAARVQADAVLFLRSVTDTNSYANVLSVLDITLVGMFLVPGHQRDALTILEGMIVDNRNQYVYFATSVEGSGSATAPLAMFDQRDAVAESRKNALRAFGEQLVKDGRRVLGRAPGSPPEATGR